jgi:hypothetical protein
MSLGGRQVSHPNEPFDYMRRKAPIGKLNQFTHTQSPFVEERFRRLTQKPQTPAKNLGLSVGRCHWGAEKSDAAYEDKRSSKGNVPIDPQAYPARLWRASGLPLGPHVPKAIPASDDGSEHHPNKNTGTACRPDTGPHTTRTGARPRV